MLRTAPDWPERLTSRSAGRRRARPCRSRSRRSPSTTATPCLLEGRRPARRGARAIGRQDRDAWRLRSISRRREVDADEAEAANHQHATCGRMTSCPLCGRRSGRAGAHRTGSDRAIRSRTRRAAVGESSARRRTCPPDIKRRCRRVAERRRQQRQRRGRPAAAASVRGTIGDCGSHGGEREAAARPAAIARTRVDQRARQRARARPARRSSRRGRSCRRRN